MPWKLLYFILIIAVVLTFVGFNLGNSSDISVVFHSFKNVPVVITILASFLFGLLVAFFFALGKLAGDKSRKPAAQVSAKITGKEIPQESTPGDEPVKPTASTGKARSGPRKSRVKGSLQP